MTASDRYDAPSILDYLQVLLRRWWAFLLPVLVVPAVAVFLSTREPATYQASARYLLTQTNPAENASGAPAPYVDPAAAARAAQTEAERARSVEVARRAVTATASSTALSPEDLLSASTVVPSANSDFLFFTVVQRDPETATLLANAYARAYADHRYESNQRALRAAQRSTQQRLRELQAAGLGDTEVYKTLLETQAQLEIAEALPRATEEAVEPAPGADAVPSQTIRAVGLGLALGLVLGIGFAFLLEALDPRVRSAHEVSRRLGLRLLGKIPSPRRNPRDDGLVMTARPTSAEADAYRFLRANVEAAAGERVPQTIMVTSAGPGEGTSTTVANLAVAFARAGRHVIVVDADVRRPSLHDFFAVDTSPGFLDSKLGRLPIDEALQIVSIRAEDGVTDPGGRARGRLEVLTAGEPLHDPDELESGMPLGAIFGQLRERAEVVLIDAPAVLSGGDAITLSAHVDAVLVVARLGVIRSSTLEELSRVVSSWNSDKLGVVLTDTARGQRLVRRPDRARARERHAPVVLSLPPRPSQTGTRAAAGETVNE